MEKVRKLLIWSSCLLVLVAVLPLKSSAQNKAFTYGFRERLRHTYMNNNMDFNANSDDKQGFFRVRTNLWGQFNFNSHLTARVQLTNEFRPYTIVRERDKSKDFTLDEIIFDNLFLKYNSGGDNPVILTVGRQNLIYGEGFILLEGGPWDGSRAIFHDAIKLSLKRGTTTFDFLGISNPATDDRLSFLTFTKPNHHYLGLPKNAEGHQWLNDGLEQALGLYITHKKAAWGSLEGYYFYKTEKPDFAIPTFASITQDQLSTRHIHTLGGRLVHPLGDRLKLSTEWAYQTGSQANNSISAYGGYANLGYTLIPAKKGVITAGINALSGDDPNTADIEGWNPIFSRWPKWSELYIYSQTIENIDGARKVAYWTNTFAPNVKFVMNVHPKVNMTVWLHHLQAFQASGPGDGTTRGNEFQLWLKFKFTQQLSGHFLYDYFMPGDFYPAPRANASFIRFELMFTL